MAERPIAVTTALMPLYYKDFQCIMGACQDNCCDDGWKIEFSKKDYLKLKRAPKSPELEEMMLKGVVRLREKAHDDKYAAIRPTVESRCLFHTAEGLCALQMECGVETLPYICKIFPRIDRFTPVAREYSLSPACEGVLALLWDLPQGIDFWEEPLPRKDWVELTSSTAAAARFGPVRSLCVDILQNRSLRLSRRFLLLGLLLQRLQELDWNDGPAFDRCLAQMEPLLYDPAVAEQLDGLSGDRGMFLVNNCQTLLRILVGRQGALAQELISAVSSPLKKDGEATQAHSDHKYRELEEKLDDLLDHSEHFFENLMVAMAFHLGFPMLSEPGELWKSYVHLCSIYSLYRFAAVCAMDKEASRARLFHVLVQISRLMLNSDSRQAWLCGKLFENDSATLAHMAILLD